MIKLDFEQRQRAHELDANVANGDADSLEVTYELIYLRDRVKKLESVLNDIIIRVVPAHLIMIVKKALEP